MKKRGIINAQLAGLLAGLGHKDLFMVADGGMPVPKGVEIVDLALCGGVPTFRQVMDAVLDEVQVEGYTLAEEIVENNYNLSVSTYVEAEDTREKIDIVKLNAEIEEIVTREQVLRDEIDKIIREIGADGDEAI